MDSKCAGVIPSNLNNMLARGVAFAALSLVGPASGLAATAYADLNGVCGGNTPCSTTIADAVTAAIAGSPAEVRVFPGEYTEDVLVTAFMGDLTFQAVDSAGSSAVRTVTVIGTESAIEVIDQVGAVTVNGFVFQSANEDCLDIRNHRGDITVTGVTASGCSDDGIDVTFTDGATGTFSDIIANSNQTGTGLEIEFNSPGTNQTWNISLSNIIANGNSDQGIAVVEDGDIDAEEDTINVTATDIEASNNGASDDDNPDGIILEANAGTVIVSNIVVNNNGEDGIDIENADTVTIDNVEARNNGDEGTELEARVSLQANQLILVGNVEKGMQIDGWAPVGNDTLGNVSITNAHVTGSEIGIRFSEMAPTSTISVSSSNIYDHSSYGMGIYDGGSDGTPADAEVDAFNIFWGTATGPRHPDNPAGRGAIVADADNNISDNTGIINFSPFAQRAFSIIPVTPVPALGGGLGLLVAGMGLVGLRRARRIKA